MNVFGFSHVNMMTNITYPNAMFMRKKRIITRVIDFIEIVFNKCVVVVAVVAYDILTAPVLA